MCEVMITKQGWKTVANFCRCYGWGNSGMYQIGKRTSANVGSHFM